MKISIGQAVIIKPEWMDAGDNDYTFTAISEPNPYTGYFKAKVAPKVPDPDHMPWSIMELHVDHIDGEPCAS